MTLFKVLFHLETTCSWYSLQSLLGGDSNDLYCLNLLDESWKILMGNWYTLEGGEGTLSKLCCRPSDKVVFSGSKLFSLK